jgi:hypothetical protein
MAYKSLSTFTFSIKLFTVLIATQTSHCLSSLWASYYRNVLQKRVFYSKSLLLHSRWWYTICYVKLLRCLQIFCISFALILWRQQWCQETNTGALFLWLSEENRISFSSPSSFSEVLQYFTAKISLPKKKQSCLCLVLRLRTLHHYLCLCNTYMCIYIYIYCVTILSKLFLRKRVII